MLDRGRNLVYIPQGGGKTVVVIYVTEELRREFGPEFRTVIICFSGLKVQWEQAIRRWTGGTLVNEGTKDARYVGGADVVIVDGPQAKRAKQYDEVDRLNAPYVIVGYEQIVSDHGKVRSLEAMCYVGDEITAIKSPSAQRSQALKQLQAPFVFGLSGDPIENGEAVEVFSEMEWIDDTVLGRWDLFDKTFVTRAKGKGFIVGYKNLPEFWARLAPALVKIDEDDPRLAEFMPEMKPPREHLVDFDPVGQEVYDYMVEDLCKELVAALQYKRSFDLNAYYNGNGGDSVANAIQGRIMAVILAMRMLCDDPAALVESAEKWLDVEASPTARRKRAGEWVDVKRASAGSAYAAGLMRDGVLDGLGATPKLDAVNKRIRALLAANRSNKIVVFCTFKPVLRRLLAAYGPTAVRFDGDMNAAEKGASLSAFQHHDSTRLFLSSDAGGYGIDLPQAQFLVNVDVPYSAGKAKQRDTRHRRASSTFDEVFVDNYLMNGSIEVFYSERTKEKRRIAKVMLEGRGADRKGRVEISATSLLSYLRGGDDDL